MPVFLCCHPSKTIQWILYPVNLFFQEKFLILKIFLLEKQMFHARLSFRNNRKGYGEMFRKIMIVLLLLCFAITIPATAQNKTTEERKSADHSTKKALITSMIIAIRDNQPEIYWDCYSPATINSVKKEAIQKYKREWQDHKNQTFSKIRRYFMYDLKRHNNDINKIIHKTMKDFGDEPFIKIEGKWYIHYVY